MLIGLLGLALLWNVHQPTTTTTPSTPDTSVPYGKFTYYDCAADDGTCVMTTCPTKESPNSENCQSSRVVDIYTDPYCTVVLETLEQNDNGLLAVQKYMFFDPDLELIGFGNTCLKARSNAIHSTPDYRTMIESKRVSTRQH